MSAVLEKYVYILAKMITIASTLSCQPFSRPFRQRWPKAPTSLLGLHSY